MKREELRSKRIREVALLICVVGVVAYSIKYNLIAMVSMMMLMLLIFYIGRLLYRGENMVSVKSKEVVEEEYIESLRGIVNSEEFIMHARHLVQMSSEVSSEEQSKEEYEGYELKLKNSTRFKSEVEKKVVEDFLNYIGNKRNNIAGFEGDIRKLIYCDEKRDESKKEIKEAYEKLFRHTRFLLWKVEVYEVNGEKVIESFHNRVKHLNSNLTLEKALERMCILHEDADQILRELKGLLLVYHPDKNKYENTREVYEKVELVYRGVSVILKEYEKYYGDTIFCKFKEFLGWELKEIEGDEVYKHIVGKEMPLGYECRRKLGEYREREKLILNTKDNILTKYREIIEKEKVLLEEGINLKKEAEKGSTSKLKQKDELAANYKSKIKEKSKELVKLGKFLQLQVQELIKRSDYIINEFKKEIEKEKNSVTKDIANKYAREKRIESLEKILTRMSEEKQEANIFLAKFEFNNGLNFIKKEGLRGVIKKSFIGLYGAINNLPEGVSNIVRKGMDCGANYYKKGNLITEYDYLESYGDLYDKYERLRKEVKICKVEVNNKGICHFYIREKILIGSEVSDSGELLEKYEYRNIKQDFDKIKKELEAKDRELKREYKTQEEIEKEYHEGTLAIKELKEKSEQAKKKIEQLRNKMEEAERAKEEAIAIADIRVEIAEARAEEAIETAEARAEEAVEIAERAKEEAEAKAETERAKAETLASLLLQIRRGELPISALDNIELEVIAGPSRRK